MSLSKEPDSRPAAAAVAPSTAFSGPPPPVHGGGEERRNPSAILLPCEAGEGDRRTAVEGAAGARRLARAIACALLLVNAGASLAGCGFTPLYANPAVTPALQAVDVVTPQSRTGYLLREQLNDELGRNLDTGPRYRLAVTIDERRYPRGLRVNNIAAVYQVGLVVGYTLTDAATGAVLLRSTAPVTVSYDAPDPPYASVAAQQDAEERAANQAAVRIRLDLSRYFHRPPPAR